MTEKPKAAVVMTDFGGMIDNEDPKDIPDGAASIQINVTSAIVGVLAGRRGYREVKFES